MKAENLFDIYVAMCKKKLGNPVRYSHFVNMPGEFDAAEFLLTHCWENLNAVLRGRVSKILIQSGRYVPAQG
jgi:hypothetical protein